MQHSLNNNSSPLHVVLIAGSYQLDRCGVAHYTAHLRSVLDQLQVRSTVLTTHTAAEVNGDVSVVGVVDDWNFKNLFPLIQKIRSTTADILHIQHAAGTYGFQRPIFLLPLLLRLWGDRRPIVTTIHEYGWWEWQPPYLPPSWLEWLKEWGQRRGWWDREDGFLLTGSDALITTNRDATCVIRGRLPHLRAHLQQIPIGANVGVVPIDRPTARQQLLQTYGWPDDVAIAAFFGFLHPVKGLETLLPAFQQVVAVYPHARLLLIGGLESLALPGEQASSYGQRLQALISELKLSDHVYRTGYLNPETTSHYLTASDLGVLPFNHGVTLKSGSLLALMAHALPVVATRPESPDRELDQTSGVKWVRPRDRQGLATALLELFANPDQRQQLSRAAQTFSQSFDWLSIGKAHLDIYESLYSHVEKMR
jgi:glycosyltransferase involved in cell wall biosynthesis